MDFTRQPVIETVITAKEGCKLVLRSSKGTGQEEYFVDAVEVVSFGHSFFFRSQEKPKAFLVPATDYEVLEVREARMVLKNVGSNRSIKIAGGRAAQQQGKSDGKGEGNKEALEPRTEEKRRERRRQPRRRRNRDVENGEQEVQKEEEESTSQDKEQPQQEVARPKGKKEKVANKRGGRAAANAEKASEEIDPALSSSVLKSLLPPPSTLISDTIDKYKDNELFRDAFFEAEEGSEEQTVAEEIKEESPSSNS